MQQQPEQFAPCPNCGKQDAKKVSYTWWGGVLGPKMFNLVKCNSCGTEYNGKTGQSNRQNMIIYLIASSLILCCACGGLAFASSFATSFLNTFQK